MDSRAWLIGLGLLAVGLAAALAVDLGRSAAPPAPTRIVPEWSAGDARAIQLERPGQAAVRLERVVGAGAARPARPDQDPTGVPPDAHESGSRKAVRGADAWILRLPGGATAPVDPAALRDLAGTIEVLAATRRDAGSVDRPALVVTVERAGGPAIQLRVAATAGATDRVWLARADQDGRALVDGYAARALDVGADALRERRPLHGRLGDVTRVEVAAGGRAAVLTGPAWRIELAGGSARAAPAQVAALLERAARLRLASFDDVGGAAASGVRLSFTGPRGRAAIDLLGPCPGRPALALADTPIGRGCLAGLDDAASLADPDGWVDRDLVGSPIDRVSHLRLERGGAAVDVERAERPDVLRGWLSAWREAAAGPVVPLGAASPGSPLTAPVATIELTVDGGAREHLTVRRAGAALVVSRGDEPVGLVLHPEAGDLLDPAPHRFRSLDLIEREPSALGAALARRGGRVVESIERGETLEEWRALAPAGAAASPAAASALVQAGGFLRADRFLAARAAPAHRLSPPRRAIELVFDPEPGAAAPERHLVELGAPLAGGGCAARLDGDPAVIALSPARCAALLGPWTD